MDSTRNYTDEQGAEVAKLMKYVGYAVKMEYMKNGSGTWLEPKNLTSLGFSSQSYSTREIPEMIQGQLSDSELEAILDKELEKGRPVIMAGYLIDGGGHYTAFFKVMLPQAHSSIVTLVILALIGSWNDYSTPMMFLPDYPTVASGIYTITKSNQRSDNMPKLFAGLVLSFIPVLILFSIFSDRIMKNFSIGGLKG
jgi:hypothetical protein